MPVDRDEQLSLYEKWQENDDDRALSGLLDSLEPVVEKKVQDITPPDMDTDVVRARAKNEVVNDLPDFDPEESAITTYLHNFTFPKLNRFVNKYQNTARIPEARQQKISTFDSAKERLKEERGREPADSELADELGWDLKEVQRMKQARWDDVPASSVDMLGNLPQYSSSDSEDLYHQLVYELDPEEEIVFKHLTGFKGAEKLKGKEIAEKIDVSPAKISKIKAKIEDKIRRYS